MGKTVLIIEDDNDINHMLTLLLKRSGYETISAFSGTEGLMVHGEKVDIILLDIMLPGKSGEEIIRELKRKQDVPVIVMSAIHDVSKKVDMFSLGADDYVTKPFDNEELLARISARLRNSSPDSGSGCLKYKGLELDTVSLTAVCNGRELQLSKLEFELLRLLMENPKRTCTKSIIYDKVWDYDNSADDNTLNVHISRLRKKLKECDPEQDYVETVWGVGYRLRK